MSIESTHDVRVVLVRDKYFSLRPKPLEKWLWRQAIAPSAERVFWLHWEEGHRSGNWCSEIPLKRVAAECCVDVSTVTRAYQQLGSLGLIRRQDPGRDPRNPFQQATAITEVCVPRELIHELNRHPNRKNLKGRVDKTSQPAFTPGLVVQPEPAVQVGPRRSIREGLQILSSLERKMNAAEAAAFKEAQRTQATHMTFAEDTALSAADRAEALHWLARMAARTAEAVAASELRTPCEDPCRTSTVRRALTVFELARARRDISDAVGVSSAEEILRQIAWSMEQGALRRFPTQHALNIALKKVRNGFWTRPHRMPPNWMIPYRSSSLHDQCRTA